MNKNSISECTGKTNDTYFQKIFWIVIWNVKLDSTSKISFLLTNKKKCSQKSRNKIQISTENSLIKNTHIFKLWSWFIKCLCKHETALNKNHCTPHVSECSFKVERGSISYCPDERLGGTKANRELDVTHTSVSRAAYTAYYFWVTGKYLKRIAIRYHTYLIIYLIVSRQRVNSTALLFTLCQNTLNKTWHIVDHSYGIYT